MQCTPCQLGTDRQCERQERLLNFRVEQAQWVGELSDQRLEALDTSPELCESRLYLELPASEPGRVASGLRLLGPRGHCGCFPRRALLARTRELGSFDLRR